MSLVKKHCVPCEGGTPPLTDQEEDKLLTEVPGWELDRSDVHKITRKFKFKDFKEAIAFVNSVADIAEKEDHHPNIKISYSRVEIELYTHSIRGLSENDFILAAKVNRLISA